MLVAGLGAVASWLWLGVCLWALRRRAPPAPWRSLLAVGAAAAVFTWWAVPAGPIEPNHHGYDLWNAVTDPRDLVLAPDLKHGSAHTRLWRLAWCAGLPAQHLGAASAAVASASTVVLGWALAGIAGARAGVLGALFLALWPPHLRVGPSLSGFVVAELGGVLALAGMVGRSREGSAWWVALAGAGVALTANARAEWMVLGPLLGIALWPALGVRPRLSDAAAAIPAAALVALRAGTFAASAEVGASVGAPQHALVAPLQRIIAALLVLAVASALYPEVVERARRPLHHVRLAAAGVAFACTLVAWPPAFDGVFQRWPAWLTRWLELHAWAHPEFTAPWWSVLSLVGLGLALARAPLRTLVAAGWLLTSLYVYAVLATYDSASTYLRSAVSIGWVLCALAAAGADRALPEGRRGAALAALGLGLGLTSTWGLVRYTWPDMREHTLLVQAREERGDRVVVSLLRTDVPDDARDLGVEDRAFVERALRADSYVAGRPTRAPWLVGVDDALRDPDQVAGGLWLKTLACYRVLVRTIGGDDFRVFAGDRVWSARRLSVERVNPPDQNEMRTLRDAPCWDLVDRLPTPVRGPDGAAICPEGVQPSGRPYLDPRCEAMAQHFELEPLHEEVLGTGSLSGPRLRLEHPQPVVGLYRILGRRADPAPPAR